MRSFRDCLAQAGRFDVSVTSPDFGNATRRDARGVVVMSHERLGLNDKCHATRCSLASCRFPPVAITSRSPKQLGRITVVVLSTAHPNEVRRSRTRMSAIDARNASDNQTSKNLCPCCRHKEVDTVRQHRNKMGPGCACVTAGKSNAENAEEVVEIAERSCLRPSSTPNSTFAVIPGDLLGDPESSPVRRVGAAV